MWLDLSNAKFLSEEIGAVDEEKYILPGGFARSRIASTNQIHPKYKRKPVLLTRCRLISLSGHILIDLTAIPAYLPSCCRFYLENTLIYPTCFRPACPNQKDFFRPPPRAPAPPHCFSRACRAQELCCLDDAYGKFFMFKEYRMQEKQYTCIERY